MSASIKLLLERDSRGRGISYQTMSELEEGKTNLKGIWRGCCVSSMDTIEITPGKNNTSQFL